MNIPNPKDLGKHLRFYRKARQLSQQEVGAHLGIPRELLSYYETGQRRIPISQLERLCALYGVELKQLCSAAPLPAPVQAYDLAKEALPALEVFHRFCDNYRKLLQLSGRKSKRGVAL